MSLNIWQMFSLVSISLTFAKQCHEARTEIRLNTEATKELVEKEAPDAVIIAVGSTPLVPPIPGINGDNVTIVNNYYLEKEKVGNEVVVLGGGLAGCEAAIHLYIRRLIYLIAIALIVTARLHFILCTSANLLRTSYI